MNRNDGKNKLTRKIIKSRKDREENQFFLDQMKSEVKLTKLLRKKFRIQLNA